MTGEQARDISNKALKAARVPEVEISLSHERHGFLRFARNAPTTSGLTLTGQANVTAWKGKRKASAAGAVDLANPKNAVEELKRLVAQAEHLAAISPEDREYLPLLGPQKYLEVAAYDPDTAEMTAAKRAQHVADAIRVANERKVIVAGLFEQRGTEQSVANSAGLFAYHRGSVATYSVTARTPDDRGSGYTAVSSSRVGGLDFKETTGMAAHKAIESRNGKEIKPEDYPTILEPQAVADLVGNMMRGILDARRADEGRSVFSAPDGKTRIGERIFDPRVSIYTDPANRTIPSRPFDGDGFPIKPADFVRDGVLRNLSYSRYWAERSKKAAGPFLNNLIMDGTDAPLSKLIANTERGVLVTRLWYIRPVDPQQALYTGLTRDGLFWIEDGKVQHPLKNFRFNESPYRLLGDIEEIGQVLPVVAGERYGDFRMMLPALRLKSFRFTSVSDAV
ncbi:MAG: TldD/PmbA family protein [Bryobacteraceae bacterium]|nr:TldD/PmbA family protein [Bryobacteraceae bacterium]